MTLPIADWQTSLAEMELALNTTLVALDRYQEAAHRLLSEPATTEERPDRLVRLEGRLTEWDTRLAAASELAVSVERELNDRRASVAGWQELFEGWRRLIEQQ